MDKNYPQSEHDLKHVTLF